MSDELDEELDSENQSTEEVENTTTIDETVADTGTEDVEKLKEQNKRLFERAKKAEAEARKLKATPEIQQTKSTSSVDADELKLIARGLSDEEIEKAKVIAKGNEISLLEAVKDPLFVAFQDKLKEQAKREKAKLNASRGSSQEVQKSISELSREEHEKLAMEMAKNIQ